MFYKIAPVNDTMIAETVLGFESKGELVKLRTQNLRNELYWTTSKKSIFIYISMLYDFNRVGKFSTPQKSKNNLYLIIIDRYLQTMA